MSGWPIVSLGSVVKFVSGGTPSKEDQRYWSGDIPWVSSAEMKQRWISDTQLHVSEDGAKAGSRRIPKNTVLAVVRGMSLAKEFRVSITKREMTFNQDLKALLPSGTLSPVYLFYYLLSQNNAIRDSASEAAHGTKKLDMPVLEQWPIPIPPLATQQKIAAILSTYDDLIANNQRRITLLERMAEDIYREWFVRLRFPGHEDVKVEKGVPQGWTLHKFRDVVQFYMGGGWGEESQTSTHSETAYVIRGTDIPRLNASEIQIDSLRFHTPSNLKSRLLQKGDLVFEVSGGSKDQLLGRNLLISEKLLHAHDGRVIAASFCKMLRFNQALVSPYAMKYFFKLYYETDLVGLYQVQSTGISNYQFESFLDYQTVLCPPMALQSKFDTLVKPMLELKDDIALQTAVLKRTRDSLLPRLISGKLSVDALDIRFPPGMLEPGA